MTTTNGDVQKTAMMERVTRFDLVTLGTKNDVSRFLLTLPAYHPSTHIFDVFCAEDE